MAATKKGLNTDFCFPENVNPEERYIIDGYPNFKTLKHGQIGDQTGVYQSIKDSNVFVQVWFDKATHVIYEARLLKTEPVSKGK